jgi:pimeloyl-ACP methyl ester carboxylesterase
MGEMWQGNPKSETRNPKEIRRKKIRNGDPTFGSSFFGFRISGFTLFCVFLAGCSVPAPRPAPLAIIPPTPHPYLLHLPGIGGTRKIDLYMTDGLKQGGFTGQIDIYDWTENDEGLSALVNDARHRRQAKIIAEKLTQQYDKDPTSPIYLSCHSGGAGLAIWALEDTPDRVKVRTLLLLAPALSPNYDLTKALRHVTGNAYSFNSLNDVVLWGCRWTGTVDGLKTDGAGRVGFTKPPAGDEQQYAKLIQFPYQSDWIRLGDRGDHIGAMSRSFSREVLAPLVLSGKLPAIAVPVSPAPTASNTSDLKSGI